jgi:DNA-binding Xre family transcriptional regulator
MKWNLRLAAAHRDIWKASELQRLLAERGLVISAGKMSGLWSGQPVSLKLDDLDVICAVLGCEIGELLVPEPDKVPRPGQSQGPRVAEATSSPTVVPRRRDGRSPPPTAARTRSGWVQPTLVEDVAGRDYRYGRVDLRSGPAPDNPWLAWALHLAHTMAEARGFDPDGVAPAIGAETSPAAPGRGVRPGRVDRDPLRGLRAPASRMASPSRPRGFTACSTKPWWFRLVRRS